MNNKITKKYEIEFKKNIMKKILCLIGLHKWEMTKYTIRKGKHHQTIVEEGFDRECERCEKEQRLEKPKEYHPCKYVWTNVL